MLGSQAVRDREVAIPFHQELSLGGLPVGTITGLLVLKWGPFAVPFAKILNRPYSFSSS
jgi:hypothetical protein